MNHCVVKYIHLKSIDPTTLHTTEDFEFSKAQISHSSFEEMENWVKLKCPHDFVCFDPVALHHEVLWRTSLRANGNGIVEVDQLFQPIDDLDYMTIKWCKSPTEAHMVSVCVHVEQQVMILS